jgi:hypothetical protein
MANQAIALQARAPQGSILGGSIQRNAQMMNMMSQQRSAERQAEQAAQQMQMAQRKEERDITQAEIDNASKLIDFHYKRATAVRNTQGYESWLAGVRNSSPEFYEFFVTNLPPGEFSREELVRMVGSIKDNFDATYPKASAEAMVGEDGGLLDVRTGGFGRPAALQIPEYGMPSQGAPAQTPFAPQGRAPATDAQIDEVAQKILRGAGVGDLGISAQDFDRAAARANELSAGGGARMQPISMTDGPQMAGAQPDLGAIVQDMMSSKQVTQSNLEAMRAVAGPDKDQQLAQLLRDNGIRIVPDDQGSMRNAAFRPGEDAAPQMQLAQAIPPGYEPTGRPARVKDPMQSPVPGSAVVPIPRVREQAEAEREPIPRIGERVTTEERARRLEKLRGDQPRALADARTVITNLDDRIEAIDAFLRNPYRNSVIGSVEGYIPEIAMFGKRADAFKLYQSIISNQVLNELIRGRQQTETGASPMGIVSDRDLAVAAAASNRLIRTGTEKEQEKEMQRLRDILYRTRELAIKTYEDTYREVAKDAPELKLRVRNIPARYKQKPTQPTQTRGGSALSPATAKKYGL